MRKKRGQYKVCGRLGYNARLRLWLGKKKKWEKVGRFADSSVTQESTEGKEQKKIVNPAVRWTNDERRGSERSKSDGKKTRLKGQSSRIRRKDVHGMLQSQKTGRKRRYGGVKRKNIRKDLREQMNSYKRFQSASERRYRKGSVQRGQKETHRRARTEVRVDVRRWRSGRVPTLQMSRELVEHGYVDHVNEQGEITGVVKWQGSRVEVGHGRKVNEKMWKTVKGVSRRLVESDAYGKAAAGYVEADYVTGRRVLLRKPRSTEVVMPKGMELSVSSVLYS